ncbi:hypothetical protein Rumeso_02373 [Rubellimicrobium mesophilum DSM 19309]|uniref:Uncharacterized protein n=1 Tax=Rubellimicrobium mesophilum DSM 19309 TaxID=442562 RepID=A0A017HNZ0_9RHOB|nr:hypothetical protein Rumeso_02373 [Rubellimicrobium mesophilum DSM 19309]
MPEALAQAQTDSSVTRRRPGVATALGRVLGVTPFVIFTALFLIIPTLFIVLGAFRSPEGASRSATSSSSTPRRSARPTGTPSW